MQQALMIAGIAAGALAQLFMPGWPIFAGIKPPVLVAFVLYYAMRRARRGTWVALCWAALLQDGLDLGSFGPAMLAFPAIGLLAQRIRAEIFVDGLVTQMVMGALGAMVATFFAAIFYALNGQRPFLLDDTFLRIAGSGLLGMATLPAVSVIMNRLEQALPKKRGYGWQ